MQPLIDANGINKYFVSTQVLFDVDFELLSGEIHCLIGENGAGKSTLVKILTGVYTDYTGNLLIDGQPCRITNPRISQKVGISTVQQSRDLIPLMDAVENIFLGKQILKNGILQKKAMDEKAKGLLDMFGINLPLHVPVEELKPSEQCVVAICKAVYADSKILLVDEASASLDNQERLVLYGILNKLKEEGKGIVYISHHLDEVLKIGDRVTVLRNGRRVWTKSISETDHDDLIASMTGKETLYARDEKRSEIVFDESVPPILEFRNITSKNVRNVSFAVNRGEILGFCGLEDSNKHHIAEIAFGLEPVQSGSIYLNGKEQRYKHNLQAIRSGMGYVPNDRKRQGLILCRNIIENVSLASINKKRDVFVSPRRMGNAAMNEIRNLNIVCTSGRQLVRYLSGGNQQKVLLAKWMQANSDLLFLHEPTEGIDIGARTDLYEVLHKAADDDKRTIIIFSSDLDELIALSDRVITMNNGEIVNCYHSSAIEKISLLSDIVTKMEKRDDSHG